MYWPSGAGTFTRSELTRSGHGGQVVQLLKQSLLQRVIAKVACQRIKAVGVFDKVAIDELVRPAFALLGPVFSRQWTRRRRRGVADLLSAQVGPPAGLFDELPVGRNSPPRRLFVPQTLQLDQRVPRSQQVAGEPVMPLADQVKLQRPQVFLEGEMDERLLVAQVRSSTRIAGGWLHRTAGLVQRQAKPFSLSARILSGYAEGSIETLPMQIAVPTIVRPRCFAPDTAEVVLVEDLLADFVERRGRGIVQLAGGLGTGKTTALEYLAGLPQFIGVRFADDPTADQVSEAALNGVLVRTSRTGRPDAVDLHLTLAPWSEDELIEYLLAAHHDECGSVLSRLTAAEDRDLTDGVPELTRAVLDAMAEDSRIGSVRTALHRVLDQHLDNDRVRDLAGSYAWALQSESLMMAEQQGTKLGAAGGSKALSRLLRFDLVQRLAAANHLFQAMAESFGPLFLIRRWPRELVDETARCIRTWQHEPSGRAALDYLTQSAAEPGERFQSMAGSLLLAAGQPWRPDRRRTPFLDGAYLTGASWAGIDLTDGRLYSADLNGANLNAAQLKDARAHRVQLRRASLRAAVIEGIEAAEADLSEADLLLVKGKGASFVKARLVRACCESAILPDTDLGRADLSSADFRHADLSAACLVNATIEDADFSDARLNGANLAGLPLHKAELQGAIFAAALMRGVDLEGVVLSEPDFEDAVLVGAHLTGSRMRKPNFRGADLRNTGLAEIDWPFADLRDADLRECTFHMGSTRSGLLFTPYASEGTRTGFYTDEYQEQSFKRPEEIRKANLRGADLRGAKIGDVDFYLVDLRDAKYSDEQADHFRRCRAILE